MICFQFFVKAVAELNDFTVEKEFKAIQNALWKYDAVFFDFIWYKIIKPMCLPGYHHNGFVATHGLGHMMYGYVYVICMLYIFYIMLYIYYFTFYIIISLFI